mgnify:CR=1 FL=1
MSAGLLAAALASQGLSSWMGKRAASQAQREQNRDSAFQNLLGSLSPGGNIAGTKRAPQIRPSLARNITGASSDMLLQKLMQEILKG